MIKFVLTFVIGYMFGNFPPGYLGVKYIKKADIRDFGSGNIGMTNVNRVLGFKYAFIALLLDMLKGILAVLIGRWIGGEIGALIGGIGAVIGHNWPAVLGFRGGKGVATTSGVLLALFPPVYGVLIAIFLLVVILTRYVSLGSIIAGIFVPIVILLFGHSTNALIFGIVLGVLILARHHENIRRLLKGKESKLKLKKPTG